MSSQQTYSSIISSILGPLLQLSLDLGLTASIPLLDLGPTASIPLLDLGPTASIPLLDLGPTASIPLPSELCPKQNL
jgi:hypothetical protein